MARVIRLQGTPTYSEVHELQRQLVDLRARDEAPDLILLLEHAQTITVGRARGAEANVLDAGDIPVVRVERGGDVTWHGPGQLVAYPIVALSGRRQDLHLHLRSLETAVISLLEPLGLSATRDPRNTGVWLAAGAGPPKKVCSVGIACRRWVTWHGLALNVAPDLSAFARIHPCGFDASIMTRLVDHLDRAPALEDLMAPLATQLCHALDVPQVGSIEVAAPTVASVLA